MNLELRNLIEKQISELEGKLTGALPISYAFLGAKIACEYKNMEIERLSTEILRLASELEAKDTADFEMFHL